MAIDDLLDRARDARRRRDEAVAELAALMQALYGLGGVGMLDVTQRRELARERRRMRYRPEDHDTAQLEWLEAGLAAAERDRPGGWRVVYLHHPLFSSIGNHCTSRTTYQGSPGASARMK